MGASPAATAERTNRSSDSVDPTALPKVDERLAWIPLAEIHESPHNPRKHFDPAALEQLMDSLLQSGQLEPVLVRPRLKGGYELAAGHRRFRAATLACKQHAEGAAYRGLEKLRAIVREMDNRTFIETLNVDNLQRDDLHPLEEAQGFQDLMTSCGYDVKKIAARIGKSKRYVYDSLTLLKLISKAKKLFLAGAFERGHAVELARLGAGDQKRALGDDDEGIGVVAGAAGTGLFIEDRGQGNLELDDDAPAARKPVSVREFRRWVDEHVRFPTETADPMLFPETAEAIQSAVAEREKVVEITYGFTVPPDARDKSQPRVVTARSWRSATPGIPNPEWPWKEATKGCEHSVLGVVVIGERRGESFRVCLAKEKCKTHWEDWQRERRKRKREKDGDGTSGPGVSAWEKTERERQARWDRENAERTRWKKAGTALGNALGEKIVSAPIGIGTAVEKVLTEACRSSYGVSASARKRISRGRTTEDLVRYLAYQCCLREIGRAWNPQRDLPKLFKSFGLDAKKIVDEAVPKPKAKKAAKKKATKTAGRRKKR